jgi:hypothetical protein
MRKACALPPSMAACSIPVLDSSAACHKSGPVRRVTTDSWSAVPPMSHSTGCEGARRWQGPRLGDRTQTRSAEPRARRGRARRRRGAGPREAPRPAAPVSTSATSPPRRRAACARSTPAGPPPSTNRRRGMAFMPIASRVPRLRRWSCSFRPRKPEAQQLLQSSPCPSGGPRTGDSTKAMRLFAPGGLAALSVPALARSEG